MIWNQEGMKGTRKTWWGPGEDNKDQDRMMGTRRR